MKKYRLLLLLLIFGSCARTDVRLSLEKEQEYFLEARSIVAESIPFPVLIQCKMYLGKEFPKVTAVDEIKEYEGAIGLYNTKTKEIKYVKGRYYVLVHEYQHYFNDGLSYGCLNEVSAYYAGTIMRLKEQNRALQKRIRHLKQRVKR